MANDTNKTPISSVDVESQLRQELLALQLRREKKQDADATEQENQQIAARKQNALSQEAARQEKLRQQEGCAHRKPNNTSAIAGQRDHQHNSIYLCQYCQKEYDQHTLPANLRPDPNFIGGPT